MAVNTNPVKGTRDYLYQEMLLRDYVQGVILDTYRACGFTRIATPALEDINLLDKSDGGENLNLIFKILKRGQKLDLSQPDLTERDIVDAGLRYDLTLPLSRYYANNRAALREPFKVIQIDKVYRAERPQKGRLREFYQCDIDIIGDKSHNAEVELIYTTAKALRALGFEGFTVRVNDRRILHDMILAAGFAEEDVPSVCITFDKLDKVGLIGVRDELLQKKFDETIAEHFCAMVGAEGDMLENAARVCKNADIVNDLKCVMEQSRALAEGNYQIEYDQSLVRGMGYYTGMVFEIADSRFSGSIAGGGRYDKMVGKLAGEDVPAVGFSIGFERILEILNSIGFEMPKTRARVALLYDREQDDIVAVLRLAEQLRGRQNEVTVIPKGKKLGKQLDALRDEGFDARMIFGKDAEPAPFQK